jgi:hypothetical protein
MKTNLFINYYTQGSKERQQELEFCLQKNINAGFDSINILIHPSDLPSVNIVGINNVELHVGVDRPTINYFFKIMSQPKFSNDINILANTDIFFEDLQQIKNYGLDANTCLALSRWDYSNDGTSILFDRTDSQDTWIFYGSPKIRTPFEMNLGVAGIDNRLAYELQQSGYNVINPSKTIKTFHYHSSNIRYWNQGDDYEKVPPPYLLLPTTY